MSSRLGIYDIFSRIVPGGFYLGTFLQFAIVLDLIEFNWAVLKELGVLASIGLALVAFVMGSAMDRAGFEWQRLFRPPTSILDDFKREHQDWKIDYQEKDWAILRAYIYIHNLNVGDEIDRHNALSIMMRNISLGFALLGIAELIQSIVARDWRYAALVILLLFLSYQSGIQARNMRDWFYRSIYETIIAYGLNLEEKITPAKLSQQASKEKRKQIKSLSADKPAEEEPGRKKYS
jgi:hypothetical protein